MSGVWQLYFCTAGLVLLVELAFLVQMLVNYRFCIRKHSKKRDVYKPQTALIVPCKGLDSAFDANITSLYFQDYDHYSLWFVVSDVNDPAYDALCTLRDRLSKSTKAAHVNILVAGHAAACSQKIHNLLFCYTHLPGDIEVIAFADSDACLRNDWLRHLVYPLRQEKTGVSTGYRWFIPQRNNIATLALSSLNAKIAQLLGAYRFNQAWGGSMAIRTQMFRELKVDQVWCNSISDDLILSYLVKKAKKKIAFVPACLVASYEQTTWPRLFEFARRQFLITRVSMPNTWWFGFLSSLFSVVSFYAAIIVAIIALMANSPWKIYAAIYAVLLIIDYCVLAGIRQNLMGKLLPNDKSAMKYAAIVDIVGNWFFSAVLFVAILSSAFGRTIRWRGLKYKLLGPTKTLITVDQIDGSPTR